MSWLERAAAAADGGCDELPTQGCLGLGVKPHKCSGAITRDYEGRPSEILEHAERDVLSSSSIARGGVEYWSYWTVWRLYDGLHPAESGQKKLA